MQKNWRFVRIPRIRIPVKTGRNISVVIEAAAMNYRAKEMGFDATKIFEERLTNLISQNEVKDAWSSSFYSWSL